MSLPTYSEFRDSGVAWAARVPIHWETWKLAHAFDSIGSGTTPPTDEPTWYSEGTIPWVTTGELREGVIFQTAKSVTSEAIEKFTSLRRYSKGALVLAMYGATIGRLGILGVEATVNQACCVLSGPRQLFPRFVFHWLVGFKKQIVDIYSTGGGQPNISQEIVSSLRIPAPGWDEQANIAAFLDRETSKIDALIAEQERLITLLAEKRQATISQAVTRGLNPDAPMKVSGVVWLGEVPTHWDIVPLKYLVELRSGGTPSKDNLAYWEGDVPWASAKDLKVEELRSTSDCITQTAVDEGAASLVRAGAVLVVVRGMILARTFPVVETRVPMAINQDLKAVLPLDRLNASFLAWLLRASAGESLRRLDEAGHGTKALRMDAWTSMQLPVPPLSEQAQVARFLSRETAKLDALCSDSERAIGLLNERRSALITAAVTGQIDIRAN